MNKFLSLSVLIIMLFYMELFAENFAFKELSSFTYETPTGQQVEISKDVELIIVAFEKDIAMVINDYLDTQDASYLVKHNTIFIADVHKMPKMIAKIVALPKLQKYKHPIYLYYGNKLKDSVLKKEAKITLLHVEDEKIKEVSYISTQDELKIAIQR